MASDLVLEASIRRVPITIAIKAEANTANAEIAINELAEPKFTEVVNHALEDLA